MTSKPSEGQDELKNRKFLFEFWRDVPTLRFIDESFFTIMNQEVRGVILDILREGILDDSIKSKTRRRYALNAQELQKYVGERLQRELTLSNIYFHIQKLREIDCVQELVSIREGKYNVAYFSRTAKLFCSSIQDSEKNEKFNVLRKLFLRLIPFLDPTIKKETIMNLFDEIYQYRLEREQLRFKWLEKHAELLTDLEFDILPIDEFLKTLEGSDSKGSQLYSQLSNLINYQ